MRLDGLPLALATAGAYLTQSLGSFDEYLESYNDTWSDLGQYSRGIIEYDDRTLFSTWNVSFQRVQALDPEAAELLKLMAYLDNQDFWYELFRKDVDDAPAWWTEVTKSRSRFDRAISTLHSYSLLEISAGQCSMHMCEHDWTLEYLNHQFDQERFRIAVHCVAANVKWDHETEYWVNNRRVLPHARRFQNPRIKTVVDWSSIKPRGMSNFGELYSQNFMYGEAEEMYMRALRGYEMQELETKTLNTVNDLGVLYADQGKLTEAEEMYMRALRGYEKQGLETETLDTVNNLGALYVKQGKLTEAEKMYMRALRGYEKQRLETKTLNTVNNLGILYADQGKLAEAEEMYMRALRGYEKQGLEHTSTLDTVHNLGSLYHELGKTNPNKFAMAEEMYVRALRGYEKTWGLEHTSTLDTVNGLGDLYEELGRLTEAEEMFTRALRGSEKAFGKDHSDTQLFSSNLKIVQEKLQDCEGRDSSSDEEKTSCPELDRNV